MATNKLIAVKEFCVYHNISPQFINDLHRNDLVELVMIKRTGYIQEKNLHLLEKIIRIHSEFDISVEGISIVLHLLSNLSEKERELAELRNQLAFYR